MPFFLKPWPIVLAVLCGWVNEHQQRTIAFQNAQIAVLLEKLGQKHVLLADDQRRDLAASRLGSVETWQRRAGHTTTNQKTVI